MILLQNFTLLYRSLCWNVAETMVNTKTQCNDGFKDHLDRQLTTNMGAKSIGFSSPLSEGYCLQRIIPHYQFF